MSEATEARDELEPLIGELGRTLDRFADWVKFGDAKAGGVLVLQALGLADLLRNAGRLAEAHELKSGWGDVAAWSFWIALALAVIVVVEVSRALFPRVKPSDDSVYFFGSVGRYRSGTEYGEAVKSLSSEARFNQLAEQAWELARIASRKYGRTRNAYRFALAFLAAWGIARLALALTQ